MLEQPNNTIFNPLEFSGKQNIFLNIKDSLTVNN